MANSLRILMAVAALIASMPSGAGPVVLGREPGSRPAHELVGDLLDRFEQPRAAGVGPAPGAAISNAVPPTGLPLESVLTPSAGADPVHRIDAPLPGPVCVIGNDPVSREWLGRNRTQLEKLGASCVLVRAHSADEADALRRLARPVPVHPLPFDELARRYGIRTVPVLLLGRDAGGGP